ncbi:MAG TPA: hypothetical protein VHZ95_19955, partial [Polyangiales bacterium]|nr:hypothetical protein [Polyangiales bacterium]
MATKKPDPTDATCEALLDAFEADPALRAIVLAHRAQKKSARRIFGSNGLKVNGKLFALSVKGALVLKLPQARVDALIAAKQGER